MAKLNVDQTTVKGLFEAKKADFLIPDYQRPYAWHKDECATLWHDIFAFAFPDSDYSKFDTNEEYYLGPIVTFRNKDGKLEVIDGQQRLTTLMLLLRAFYDKYANMKDAQSIKTRENISRCIWKTDEFGNADLEALKINSEVATDADKSEFLSILKTGKVQKEMKSNYAQNYRYFQEMIDKFLGDYPSYFSYMPTRILNNCILLPIEAESQNSALRIFATLNDRGLPLSDADIFKAQFYKYYSSKGEREKFIRCWKELEEICEKNFHPITGTPMDEIFTRYMYFERAKEGTKSSTTEALRKFYEKNDYALLKNDKTFENLTILAKFWQDVRNQDTDRFSDRVLRRLFVLEYAPNSMWTYFVSVYFMHNKDAFGMLDDETFYVFLGKTIAFIWAYAIMNPGVNALRTPIYASMVDIVENNPIDFNDYKFELDKTKQAFGIFDFSNARPITKSMLAWWAFRNESQKLLSLETVFQIEHIYARNRQSKEQSLLNAKNLEVLGNKALLEQRINISASDYRFNDKKKFYKGFKNDKGRLKGGTQIQELLDISDAFSDFAESEIEERNEEIINGFMEYLKANDLIA